MSEAGVARPTRLDPPVNDRADHVLGDAGAEITLVEYGSYNCPTCRAANGVIADLRDRFGARMRYVFRHRPITDNDVARRAAELAQYADESTGQYWQAHEALMRRGPALRREDLDDIAAELRLPPLNGTHQEEWRRAQAKVQEDISSAWRSGARVSPTFFINNRRYEGPWDESALTEAMLGSLGHRVQTAALDFARWAPSSGLLLLTMIVLALFLSNSPAGPAFESFWETRVGWNVGQAGFQLPMRDWLNDGLLAVFFLVVGLEIKRELTVGRLSTARIAALPFAAAAGGMLVPASLYLLVAPSGPLASGWAIPTTTDTAFAIAVIALLGQRVPVELRIFLTAAVVVDDLVAIAIIAVFYSGGIDVQYTLAAVATTSVMVLLNRGGIYAALPYGFLGMVLWGCLHGAGLHATLAGVIVAAVTPTRPPGNLKALMAQAETVIVHELRRADERVLRHGPSEPALRALDAIHDRIESPASKLLRSVEPWSSYFVLPLFALANSGLAWSASVLQGHEKLMLAIVLGLVVGKPVGMALGAALAVRSGIAVKPEEYTWQQMIGAGALAGIGFTMSLYIAHKAFPDDADFAAAKIGIFLASVLAGALGTVLLWLAAGPAKRSAADNAGQETLSKRS
ncbi:MAG TPA: Na+/H+ antiporter NhaA [Candidatus Binatia bacterium]|nr:Na+/H+ antiporter NhaA [Candidatus Binatia bacterium]